MLKFQLVHAKTPSVDEVSSIKCQRCSFFTMAKSLGYATDFVSSRCSYKLNFVQTKYQLLLISDFFLQLLSCKSSGIWLSGIYQASGNCHKLDKTNGQTKWTEYNKVPSLLGYSDGRSFINTPKGVYAFGYGGIAFLPKGKKEWTEGPKLPNSNFKFYYSCPVLISDTEIMLLGGAPIASYGKQVIKNWVYFVKNVQSIQNPESLNSKGFSSNPRSSLLLKI